MTVRFYRVFLIASVFFISGCGAKELRTHEFQVSADAPDPAKPPTESYTIGIGDVLDIAVWKEPTVSGIVTVRPDGFITLPLVNDVQVMGLTTTRLREVLEERYKEFINTPAVTVRVQTVATTEVFVVGEATTPGAYPVVGNNTILQLLTRAGGLTPFADRDDIRIVRRTGEKVTEYLVDYDALLEGDVIQDIVLKPGDRIIIP